MPSFVLYRQFCVLLDAFYPTVIGSNRDGCPSIPLSFLLIRVTEPCETSLHSTPFTVKKRVESILDFRLICHLHSGTYC